MPRQIQWEVVCTKLQLEEFHTSTKKLAGSGGGVTVSEENHDVRVELCQV